MEGEWTEIETFLPGKLVMGKGRLRDYIELERFHYLKGRPAMAAGVWVVRYAEAGDEEGRVVGVGVLTYPAACRRMREKHFGTGGMTYGEKLRFANANLRTISRVVVHPQFRAMGLASKLVRWICEHCSTRYVEASARMGRVHPFFEKGGMEKIGREGEGPMYFLWDRENRSTAEAQRARRGKKKII